jgi:hypothetical protein
MTNLQNIIDGFLTSDFSKETGRIMTIYGSQCSSIIEYGSRGGISGTIILGALVKGRDKSKYRPRFVTVDLLSDISISNLEKISKENNISFQFWKGHCVHYPIHETDGFVWDVFHSGGALFRDLTRIAPYIHKYIMVFGIGTFGSVSEAVKTGNDIGVISRELHLSEEDTRMNMRDGISKFLGLNNEWVIEKEFGEICVLARKNPSGKTLFSA